MTNKPSSATPTVSRICLDGTLIELLYDPIQATTQLAIHQPGGKTAIEDSFELPTGERLVPYAASNNLLTTGCVLLSSAVGEYEGKSELLERVRDFIHRHVDLSPLYEEIAAHYVLLSWVHDAFNEMPYLRFRGDFGTGKTRALLAVGSISYKPFFASGASTVSPIFHVLDAFGGTLVLDEADLRFSDATADLSKILNNGTMKGLPVLRTMSNRHRELNPQAFQVFGPKIIAMRESFTDEALESRFLTEETRSKRLRSSISISVPDEMKAEAQILRNDLLAWRFAARDQVSIAPDRAIENVSYRANQIALPLLALVDDERLRDDIAAELRANDTQISTARSASVYGTMVTVMRTLFRTSMTPYIPIGEIAAAFNQEVMLRGHQPLSAKAVGSIVRTRLCLETTKTRGVYVVPQSERSKILSLALRYGLPPEDGPLSPMPDFDVAHANAHIATPP